MRSVSLLILALLFLPQAWAGRGVYRGLHQGNHRSRIRNGRTREARKANALVATHRKQKRVAGYTRKDGTHVDGYERVAGR